MNRRGEVAMAGEFSEFQKVNSAREKRKEDDKGQGRC